MNTSDEVKDTPAAAATAQERSVVEKVAHAAGWVMGAVQSPGELATRRPLDVLDAIQTRRSHKRFRPGPLSRDALQTLLSAAVLAPNHKMTQPWGFLVLGPRAQHAYADCKARLKYGDHMGAEGREKAQEFMAELLAVPAVIGVTQKLDVDAIRREEDYAAVFMAVQNLLLAAPALGLSGKVHTGSILDDTLFRSALGLEEGERLVAVLHVGEPLEELPPKKRAPASDKTRWLD